MVRLHDWSGTYRCDAWAKVASCKIEKISRFVNVTGWCCKGYLERIAEAERLESPTS